MPKIKILVVPALIALAAAVTLTGCALFRSDTSTSSERLTTAKTVAKNVLQLVCTAYNSGGDTLASEKIDEMTANGKLTETQATALKGLITGGVGVLEKIANSEDSSATTATTSATAETK